MEVVYAFYHLFTLVGVFYEQTVGVVFREDSVGDDVEAFFDGFLCRFEWLVLHKLHAE